MTLLIKHPPAGLKINLFNILKLIGIIDKYIVELETCGRLPQTKST